MILRSQLILFLLFMSLPCLATVEEGKLGTQVSTTSSSDTIHVDLLKLNFYAGLPLYDGELGRVVGSQLGVAPFSSLPLYVGLEGNFMFFSEEKTVSLVSALLGGWYEFSPLHTVKWGFFVGLLAGVADVKRDGTPPADQFPFLPQSPTVFYLDLGMGKPISELAMFRIHFRPGLIEGRFAMMFNLGIQFRFFRAQKVLPIVR